METIDYPEVIKKFDSFVEKGFCKGLGSIDSLMCVEAAMTQALGLPFSDDPKCVVEEFRLFKIALNDKNWSSPHARARGLRNLGIAQLGSKNVVDGKIFLQKLSVKIMGILIPTIYKEIFTQESILQLVDILERETTQENCKKLAAAAAYAATTAAAAATFAAAYAATTAAAAYAADAYADAAATAANAAADTSDKYLIMCADLALEVLKELKSPGCEWL